MRSGWFSPADKAYIPHRTRRVRVFLLPGENMIYTTGTIAGSSKNLTGAGTDFTAAGSLIRNGCTVIVWSNPPQAFQITDVTSATQLAVSPAVNPAIPAGTRYAILLSDSKSLDGFALDLAETFGIYQRYMGGFADVVQSSGTVTITINGKAVTVPGLQSVVQKDALGSAATKNTGEGDNNVLAPGSFGVGSKTLPVISDMWDKGAGTRFCNVSPSTSGGPGMYGSGIRLSDRNVGSGATPNAQQSFAALVISGRIIQFMAMADGDDSGWMRIYHTGNTTRASDGTLKAASPIARIVKSREESTRPDIDEQGYSWCGNGTCNDEAEGISITRLGVGEYKIVGSAGLAKSGWRLSPPRDPNGSGDLGIVEAEETEAGGITIRLYKRRYMLTDDGDIELVKGALIDVPADSWIDARLDMPENSVYNQKRLAAEAAMAEAEDLAKKAAENVDQFNN